MRSVENSDTEVADCGLFVCENRGMAASWFRFWVLLIVCCTLCLCPRPYDNDLRVTVVYQRLVLHMSTREVATLNGISTRTARRYIERWNVHQTVLPNQYIFGETRGRPREITRFDLFLIQDIVHEDTTRYLDEIQAIVYIRGGSRISRTQIHYWLRRMGYTRQRLFHVECTVQRLR